MTLPLVLMIGLVACSRDDRPVAATAVSACPIGIPGAHVDAVDTPDGVELRVTGPADRVDELRHRVRDAAQLHGVGAHEGLGHDGKHLGAQRHGLRLTELPPIQTRVEDIDGGAAIAIVPRLPENLATLREQLRARLVVVNAGPCD